MLTVRSLTVDDFEFGMRLKSQAGWNQTVDDWRRALEMEPAGCFVGCWHGIEAGTVTACTFGDVAWIAMVLTEESFRGRGIATGLMQHALAWLDELRIRSVRLDATALGRPVYEKLGFVVDEQVTRFEPSRATSPPPTVSAVPATDAPCTVRRLEPSDIDSIVTLDRRASGCDRTKLLQRLLVGERQRAFGAFRGATLAAFTFGRCGSRAPQVGPCVAIDTAAGVAALQHGVQAVVSGHVFLDVPNANLAAVEAVRALGFAEQRSFFRMTRGEPPCADAQLVWASSGPEYG